jgi:hypothetical protein
MLVHGKAGFQGMESEKKSQDRISHSKAVIGLQNLKRKRRRIGADDFLSGDPST